MPPQYTPEQAAEFAKLYQPSPDTSGGGSPVSRFGEQLLNLPSNILNATTKDVAHLLLSDQDQIQGDYFSQLHDVAPPTTQGEQISDIISTGLLPKAAEFALPYTALSKVAGAAGLGATASEILSQGGAAAATSTEGGGGEMLKQGIIGGVLGAVSPLSRLERLAPLAAATALGTGYDYAQGNDLQTSAIQNAVQFGFGLLPGAHNPALKAAPEIVPTESTTREIVPYAQQEIVQQPNFVRRGQPYTPGEPTQPGQFVMVEPHPVTDLGILHQRLPQQDLVWNGEQFQPRLEDRNQPQLLPSNPLHNDTDNRSGLNLVDPNTPQPAEPIATLQMPGPDTSHLKIINPSLQTPLDLHVAGVDAGALYQGEGMGLHHFREETTGSNFALKPEDATPQNIAVKAQQVRESYASQPELPEEIKAMIQPKEESIAILQTEPRENQVLRYIQSATGKRNSMKSGVQRVELTAEGREVMGTYSERFKTNKEAKAHAELMNEKLKKLTKQNGNLSGAISAHLASSLGGGVAGGLYGYAESKGDWNKAAAYASLGLVAGYLGPRTIAALLKSTPAVEKGLKASEKESLSKVAATPLKDLAGQDIHGRGGIMAKFVRGLERQTWLNMPEEVKTALSQSKGKVVALVNQVNHALNGVKDYRNVSDAIKERVSNFIQGQASDPAKAKALIASEGGIASDNWKTARPSQKKQLTAVWQVGDDIFHITPATKEKLTQMETDTLFHGLDGADKKLAEFGQAARLSVNALQELFANAMPEGSNLKDLINKSIGQYLTRGYKIFTDKSFWPTEENINKAMGALGDKLQGTVINDALTQSQAYRLDDYLPQKGALEKGWTSLMHQYQTNGNFEQLARLQNMVPLNHGGEEFMVHPDVKTNYDSKVDDDLLRGTIEDYLHQTKTNKKLYNLESNSSGLDTTLLKERQELDPTFRELIGEFKDPVEQVAHTLNRLVPTAKAAALISGLKDLQIHDLPALFEDSASWVAYKKNLQAAIDHANASKNMGELATLQSRMNELKTYTNQGPDLKFGLLKDAYVSRFVSDQFKDYNGPWGDMTNPIARGMAKVNQLSKMIHTPYNPISQARNIIQMPIFAAMARVDPTNVSEAIKAVFKNDHPLHEEMLREGITSATHASAELGMKLDKIVNGQYDSEVTKILKGIHQKVMGAYAVPDQIVRAAAYLSAKDRIALKENLPLDHPEVIKKAVEFTNRTTMNYENVAPIVRFARNIPAFNLYISYTAEIARLSKNLIEDGLKGDVQALGILGGLIATPYVIQKSAEAQLSPQDKKAWDQLQAQLPDYARNRFRMNISRDKDGKFHYIDFTPLIVTDSLHQSIDALRKGDLQSLAAVNPIVGWQNTPAWNIITQQVSGQDLFSGREFRNYNDRLETLARELTPSWTPGVGYEWQKLANIGITNQKTGKTETVEGAILRWTTGLNATSSDPNIVNRQAVGQVKHAIDLEKQYLMDVLKTDVSQAKKDRAVQVYQEAVKKIVTSYQSKLVQ